MKRLLTLLFVALLGGQVFAQTGLTVGPPRVFFVSGSGQGQTQYVDVTNPSNDYTLELAVSLEDWAYSEYGDNILHASGSLPTSLAEWVSVSESFFSLGPGETKRLQVNVQVPLEAKYTAEIPVRTAMLFVTQMNPRIGEEKSGANIRLAVRTGIKLYHRFIGQQQADLEITNLRYINEATIGQYLELSYHVTGNVWLQGPVRIEYLNQQDRSKKTNEDLTFYAMPGDKRKQVIGVPEDLPAGDYTVSVFMFFGEENQVKAAEMDFTYEKPH